MTAPREDDGKSYPELSLGPHCRPFLRINSGHHKAPPSNAAMEDCNLSALSNNHAADGSVDLHGRPVSRSLTGGWTASLLIIGVEIAERLAYGGISANLVTYLTNVMRESIPTAAKNVNMWSGVATMLPLLGAFVADSYLGRYWTIVAASLVYWLGLVMLTLSAALPSLKPPACRNPASNYCPKASPLQIGFFFFSLYLVGLGQGGHKPCLQAFGADQFDDEDPTESKYKSSFFNWWYFGICTGSLTAVSGLTYIQDNVGWAVGFGIPAGAMAVAFSVFLCGTRFYRHKVPRGSPLTRILQVFVAAAHKRHVSVPSRAENAKVDAVGENEASKIGSRRQLVPTDQFKFLEKATVEDALDYENSAYNEWRLCTVTQVEEVKLVLRLIPVWMACLTYGVVFAQSSTFFIKQGSTMDRSIGPHFAVPPAALQSFIALTIVALVPLYDRIFVPLARDFTGNERGITLLQRIGIGIFISTMSMIVAALTEIKRLRAARDSGLLDRPHVPIPLSIFWLLPQYILFGTAEVFTMIGMQEFFYDQMPDSMRSLGIAVYLSVPGVGSFLSSILISIVEQLSSRGRGQNWFADNLNRAHLDYFYWLLAALSALNLCVFSWFAGNFVYKKVASNASIHEEASHSSRAPLLHDHMPTFSAGIHGIVW